jgi:ribosomal protein L37E
MEVVTLTARHLIVGGVDGFPVKRDYCAQGGTGYSTIQNIHHGQQKLLMSEIEFLTRAHTESLHPHDTPMLCVYAGACPCIHLSHLMRMFPNVYFLLVDPQFEHIKTHWDIKRVAVCPHMFNDHTVDEINNWMHKRGGTHWVHAKLNSLDIKDHQVCNDTLFFVSDIRADGFSPSSIEHEMCAQARWFRGLNAAAGLLKFRLPFCLHGVDTPDFKYLDGTLYMPIWGPPSTTECRLYVVKGCGDKLYNTLQHERTMAGFEGGERHRPYQFGAELFPSFDTAATNIVLHRYMQYLLHTLK